MSPRTWRIARRAAILASGIAIATAIVGCRASGQASLPRPTPPPGFPIGPWTTTITRDDLTAGGVSAPDLLEQNAGDVVLTFNPDGTYQSVLSSRGVTLREPILRGRYTATGADVRLDIDFPDHYAKEGVFDVVRWTLEGDELHLELTGHGDEVAAIVYGAHPWRRPPYAGLLGTWETTITKDDLRAAGVTDPGLLNENAGRFTATYAADGTWSTAQVSLDGSPVFNPVFRGTWTATADTLEIHVAFPEPYAGDVTTYGWTRDGNELRLTLIGPEDPIGKVITEAHPWGRAGP
jgi:hypothetical protein